MLKNITLKHMSLAACAFLAGCSAYSDGSEPAGTSAITEAAAPTVPGVLLSQTAIGAEALIPNAASGQTFTYTSTDGIDGTTPNTVSGAIYLPQGTAPAGGWPLIAWSHGTVGVADRCAPSVAGRSERDLTYLSNWLAKGYAIVASDYQGLGSAGIHPYLATRPMAYNTLDAIRAVQASGFPVTEAVVVTGQSQGAAAAIATAGHAPSYAPELDLRAITATGVPFFPPAIQRLVLSAAPDTPSPNVAFTLYLQILAEQLDPSFSFEDSVSPDVWATASKAYDQCIFELIPTVMEAGLTPRQLNTPESLARQPLVFEALAYPTLALPVPAFVGSGEVDTVTPLPMQQAFVSGACAAGSTIEARVYPGGGHDEGLLNSIPDVEAFVAKAFAGEAIAGNCGG